MDLHPNEVRILKALKKRSNVAELAEDADLDVDAINRTVSWLATKNLAKIEDELVEEISLGEEGVTYSEIGFPERRMVEAIGDKGSFSDFSGKLEKHEINIGLGWLRRKNMARVGKGTVEVLSKEDTPDEVLLSRIAKEGVVRSSVLSDDEKEALLLLKSRKNVVVSVEKKTTWIYPTDEGMALGEKTEVVDAISQLTPAMIRTGAWKNKKFRAYDVDTYVKPDFPAKKHPLQSLINQISDIFVSMGFSEISGPFIESSFWNFDCLFVPQDHPAREMQDTFYLENPSEMDIEGFEKLKKKIKSVHESGGDTGSSGWNYKWDEEESKKLVLRTHTTAVTCKYLSKVKKEDLPVKVFSVGKTFRNEAIDYKHLPEFYQVEGIVVDPDANFRDLLGILDTFYHKMGFSDVRFRPAYFPYTELSVEAEVYLEDKGWMELGGAGIFRPEVVKPLLGFECPVLAWGLGLDRVVALSLGLSDIRNLYISDLDWLRKSKTYTSK